MQSGACKLTINQIIFESVEKFRYKHIFIFFIKSVLPKSRYSFYIVKSFFVTILKCVCSHFKKYLFFKNACAIILQNASVICLKDASVIGFLSSDLHMFTQCLEPNNVHPFTILRSYKCLLQAVSWEDNMRQLYCFLHRQPSYKTHCFLCNPI